MSSYLFPTLLPTPHTDKAWFPSSRVESHNYSTLDALEQEEENHMKKLLQVANTKAPDPIGSKLMMPITNGPTLKSTTPISHLNRANNSNDIGSNDDDPMNSQSVSVDRFLHLRRRRRHNRVGGTIEAGPDRVRRLPRESNTRVSQPLDEDIANDEDVIIDYGRDGESSSIPGTGNRGQVFIETSSTQSS